MRNTVVAIAAAFGLFNFSKASYEATFDNSLEFEYLDDLGNRISEEELNRQSDYELEHGIPYYRNRQLEKANLNIPVDLQVRSGFTSDKQSVARITERGSCCGELYGESVAVDSLPSNCEVVTFTDGLCQDNPFVMIPILSMASGCHSTDAFKSIRVDCRDLPL